MVSRRATVTKAEAVSVLEEYGYAIKRLLENGGGSLKTSLFNITLSIVEVFTNDEDSFDPARHQVKIRMTPGSRLRDLEKRIKATKITAEKPRPVLLYFFDNTADSSNEVITPGGAATIRGTLLKFDESNAQEGVFFVKNDNTVTKVTSKLLRNKPGELIFMIPAGLSGGTYRVEVRTHLSNTKELRISALPYDLTIASPNVQEI